MHFGNLLPTLNNYACNLVMSTEHCFVATRYQPCKFPNWHRPDRRLAKDFRRVQPPLAYPGIRAQSHQGNRSKRDAQAMPDPIGGDTFLGPKAAEKTFLIFLLF